MDDAVTAIIMSFSVLVFVIALTVCMYMVNLITATSEQILYSSDSSNFLENIKIHETEITLRNVDFDVIIPTLYRYYKENFCVKILKQDTLYHIFDIQLEGKVRSAASKSDFTGDPMAEALVKTYDDKTKTVYLHQAPWLGNANRDVKTRIDYFVNGLRGYINNVLVDYEIVNLKELKTAYDNNASAVIQESFVEYNFSGETITTEDGTETITGNEQPESKIIITYNLKY